MVLGREAAVRVKLGARSKQQGPSGGLACSKQSFNLCGCDSSCDGSRLKIEQMVLVIEEYRWLCFQRLLFSSNTLI